MGYKDIEIIKTQTKAHISDEYRPVPASTVLPSWYKKTDSYLFGTTAQIDVANSGQPNGTIKRCMPVFDVLTSGYIIPTYSDMWVQKINGTITYTLSNGMPVELHNVAQAPYHPAATTSPYPKIMNPWGIKTPKGYSCLFTTPFHGTNTFFTVLDGVVDTDMYPGPINFPFVLRDLDFEGVIPAGTPMVQVIPFKRESWKIKYSENTDLIKTTDELLYSKLFNRYKSLFWSKKEYK